MINNSVIPNGYGYGKWVDIMNDKVLAPKSGLYILFIKYDGLFKYELHKYEKGEQLYSHFQGNRKRPNGQFGNADIWSFHFVPLQENQSKQWKNITNTSIAPLTAVYIIKFSTIQEKEMYAVCSLEKGDSFGGAIAKWTFEDTPIISVSENEDYYEVIKEFNEALKIVSYHAAFFYTKEYMDRNISAFIDRRGNTTHGL